MDFWWNTSEYAEWYSFVIVDIIVCQWLFELVNFIDFAYYSFAFDLKLAMNTYTNKICYSGRFFH